MYRANWDHRGRLPFYTCDGMYFSLLAYLQQVTPCREWEIAKRYHGIIPVQCLQGAFMQIAELGRFRGMLPTNRVGALGLEYLNMVTTPIPNARASTHDLTFKPTQTMEKCSLGRVMNGCGFFI